MNRGVNRSIIFTTDSDRLVFGRLLGAMVDRFDVEVHAYCLMGNHFHLLLRCPDGGLSAAMHFLLSNYARIMNDANGRVGHLFGDRFCSRLIDNVDYLANVVRYIHLNPKDIVGAESIAQYRWSSHRTYLGRRRCPDWLTIDEILGWFDDPMAFDRFVRGRDEEPVSQLCSPAAEVMATIDMVLAERSHHRPGHLRSQRRAVALLLAEEMARENRADVLHELGITSPGARRTALSRARKLLADEALIGDTCDRTRALLHHRTTAIARTVTSGA